MGPGAVQGGGYLGSGPGPKAHVMQLVQLGVFLHGRKVRYKQNNVDWFALNPKVTSKEKKVEQIFTGDNIFPS